MIGYIGDFNPSAVVYYRFTTVDGTGAPATLSGTPVVSVYKTNSTTQTTTGVTLSVDHDGVTGLNLLTIDTSADGTFYAAGCDFHFVITTGTVGGVSAVGYVVGSLSIENRNTKADVTKWDGTAVASPATAGYPAVTIKTGTGTGEVNLSSGKVPATLASTDVTGNVAADLQTIKTQSVTCAGGVTVPAATLASTTGAVGSVTGNVGGNVAGSVGSVGTGGITASSIADGAIDRATFAADTGLQAIRSNTAQASGAGSITLDASASAVDDFYLWCIIYITGGTGVGQHRVIHDYDGTTKVALVTPNWATNPDATSTFAILPAGLSGLIADGGINAAAFATGAITASAIAANAIGASELSADAVTEIQSGLATAASIAALNNLSAAQVNAEVDTALADVGLTTTVTGRIDVAVSTRLATAGYTVPLDAAGTRSAVGLASANLDTQLDAIPTAAENASQVRVELGTELARVDVAVSTRLASASYTAPDNATVSTINTKIGTPASSVSADIAAVKTDTGNLVTRITSTLFSGITSLAQWLGLIAGKQTGNTTARTELRATGAGSGTFSELTDSLEAVRDFTQSVSDELTAVQSQVSTIEATALNLDTAMELDGLVYRFTTNALEQTPSSGGTDWTSDERTAIRTILGVPASGTTPEVPSAGALKVIDDLIDAEIAAIKAKTDNLPASPAATGDIPSAATVASAVRTELTTELGRVDVAVSTRATPAQVNTEADTALADVGLTTTVTGRIDVAVSSRGTGTALDASGVRTAVGLASANLDTQLDALPTAAENATAILAAGDVDGYTLEQTLKLCLAALAGKLSGAATTTVVIRAADDSRTRITATVDADGNRSALTYDVAG